MNCPSNSLNTTDKSKTTTHGEFNAKHNLTCSIFPKQFNDYFNMNCSSNSLNTKANTMPNLHGQFNTKHDLSCSIFPKQFNNYFNMNCPSNSLNVHKNTSDSHKLNQTHDLSCSGTSGQFTDSFNITCPTRNRNPNGSHLTETFKSNTYSNVESYEYTNDFDVIKHTLFFKNKVLSLLPSMVCNNNQCSICSFYVFDTNFNIFKINKQKQSETQCKELLNIVKTNTHIKVAMNSNTQTILYPHTTIQTNITKYILLILIIVICFVYIFNAL